MAAGVLLGPRVWGAAGAQVSVAIIVRPQFFRDCSSVTFHRVDLQFATILHSDEMGTKEGRAISRYIHAFETKSFIILIFVRNTICKIVYICIHKNL